MMNPSQPPMAPVCCLCQTVFRDPKVLPCLHTFCSDCLQILVKKDSGLTSDVTCPTCGCSVALTYRGVDGLKTNAFVKTLADSYYEEMEFLREHQNPNMEPDEGFDDHPDEIVRHASSHMSRSETWHGQTVTPISTVVHSTSVGGVSTLSSLSSTMPSVTRTDVSVSDEPTEVTVGESQGQGRMEMKKEACIVSGKFMTKLMNLQGEALRLTYAIDSVNESVNKWQDRNAEIKSQIVDRSTMLQHLLKTHEQSLLTQVDTLENRELFLNEVDRAKTELRMNLKRVLNAVEFFKQIQNTDQDEEILDMKDFLLGDLKILSSVETTQKEFHLTVPPISRFENLLEDFGSLMSVDEKNLVFEPKSGGDDGESFMKLTQIEKVKQMEFIKATGKKLRRKRAKTQQIRFTSPQRKEIFSSPQRRSTQVVTAEEMDLAMGKCSPEQQSDIQELQCTLKQRRGELLEEKKQEEDMETIHDVHLINLHRRPTRERKRRVQSFNGRSSSASRTRFLEQAAKAFRVTSDQPGEQTDGDARAHSIDCPEEEVWSQTNEDISKKLKYLRDNWRRRREIMRSSEGSSDQGDATPPSPSSPASPSHNSQSHTTTFKEFQTKMGSARHHFLPRPEEHDHDSGKESPSRRKSDSSCAHSMSSGLEGGTEGPRTSVVTFRDQNHGNDDDNQEDEEAEISAETTEGGLTRERLKQIRDKARKKRDRWRAQTLT